MAKIAILLPREDIVEQMKMLLEREPELKEDILDIQAIKTSETIEVARKMIDQGAHIIIARGIQAGILKDYTKIPVVEVVSTTQEIGLMIQSARNLVKKEHPHISMITMRNAISDTTYINKLFDVEFTPYCAETIEELELMVRSAVRDGADAIIGGDKVGRSVAAYNIPHIFSLTTEDSLRNALNIARQMSYTADVERSYNAQVESILDTTFNGVIRIDGERKILMLNRMMEELIQKKSVEIVGKKIDEIIELDDDYIGRVMDGRQESCLTSAKIRNTPVMVMIAPLEYDNAINGAIISCHKLKNVINHSVQTIQELYLSGYIAKGDFDWFYSKDKRVREAIELAKKYSLSRFPVLIRGNDESETSLFAQSIHNNSLRKNSPFVSVNCSLIDTEQQMEFLFGTNEKSSDSMLEKARYGTIFIKEIDRMNLVCQYQLFKILSKHSITLNDPGKNMNYDVRIIVSSAVNLEKMVRKGKFRQDLYYALNALVINIPPLRERKQDIEYLVKEYLKNFKESYSRYLFITEKAMDALKDFNWTGGTVQLEAFCERLFLSVTRKNVEVDMVKDLLNMLYPEEFDSDTNSEPVESTSISEAEKINMLLQRYGGNRNKVAAVMGISTTTLWRRMKKFGIMD